MRWMLAESGLKKLLLCLPALVLLVVSCKPLYALEDDFSGIGVGVFRGIIVRYASAATLVLAVISIAYIVRKWKRKSDRIRVAGKQEELFESGEGGATAEGQEGQDFSAIREEDPETGKVTYQVHPVSSTRTEVGTFSYLLLVGGIFSLCPLFGLPVAIAVLFFAMLGARKFRPSMERTVGIKLIFWSAVMAGFGTAASLLTTWPGLRSKPVSSLADNQNIPAYFALVLFGVLVISVVIHESAHGLVAYWCGDPTAKKAGRLTLNPLKHFDLFGSFVLPVIMFLATNVALGYAKPVPINMSRFGRDPRDRILASTAGVTSNLMLAFLSLALIAVMVFFLGAAWPGAEVSGFSEFLREPRLEGVPMPGFWAVVVQALKSFFVVNFVLGIINIIPIPPLDGSYVLESVLPRKTRIYFQIMRIFGFPLIAVLLIILMLSNAFAIFFEIVLESSRLIEVVTLVK